MADKYITMSKNTNIRQILAALADAIEQQNASISAEDPMSIVSKIPKRSLTGEHIIGGTILEFSSSGITDKAQKEQIVVTDKGVSISRIKGSLNVNDEINSAVVNTGTLRADVLEVKELKADIKFEKNQPVVFGGDNIYGQGLLWTASDYTKQFVFNSNPDRFFSSESIDLNKGKNLSINNIKVLDENELGSTITKSNLREVGRLRGLIVDGSVLINNYLYYNASVDRLGLGTENPNAAFSILEDNIEIMIGTDSGSKAIMGTFASHPVHIVTDSTSRLSVSAGGDIELGNKNSSPIQVTIHGSLGVDVKNPDSRAKLHVNGAIRFNDKLHLSGTEPPMAGAFNLGDIVWNSNPQQGRYIGWVCIKEGSPGLWCQFGQIM